MSSRFVGSSFIRLVLLPLAVTACAGATAPDERGDDDEVRIRVQNVSWYDLESVVVGFPDTTVDYGRIDAGYFSDYRTVPRAYRYAYVEAVVRGEELRLVPIDYVGEELLEPGRYTYELDVAVDRSGLALRLVED